MPIEHVIANFARSCKVMHRTRTNVDTEAYVTSSQTVVRVVGSAGHAMSWSGCIDVSDLMLLRAQPRVQHGQHRLAGTEHQTQQTHRTKHSAPTTTPTRPNTRQQKRITIKTRTQHSAATRTPTHPKPQSLKAAQSLNNKKKFLKKIGIIIGTIGRIICIRVSIIMRIMIRKRISVIRSRIGVLIGIMLCTLCVIICIIVGIRSVVIGILICISVGLIHSVLITL